MSEERKEIRIDLLAETMKILEEGATEQGIELQAFIQLILNEWALRKRLVNSIAGTKKDR